MKTKFTLNSFVELKTTNERVSYYLETLNNMTSKDMSLVSEMIQLLIPEVKQDLIVMGKKSLIVDLARIELEPSFDAFKQRANFFAKALKAMGISSSQEPDAIPNACLAYKRKVLSIKALKALLVQLEESNNEGELLVARDMMTKELNAIQSIEMSLLSGYSAGKMRSYINEHFVIDEDCTKVVSVKKGGKA